MNAIILAGGLSRRMNGARKAFLRLGDQTFLERILAVLRPLVDSLFIVTNEPERYNGYGARVVRDEKEGAGPLMGIYSGLRASEAEANFVTAVDTPLLAGALVEHLARTGDACDVSVPRWEGEPQPLCAVYSRRCLPAIEAVLSRDSSRGPDGPGARGASRGSGFRPRRALPGARIVAVFPFVRVCVVEEPEVRKLDPEGRSFFNVNTAADYERLRASFPE